MTTKLFIDMKTQQLIRPRIAAEKLGVALSTIYRMFDRGELTRVKISEAAVGIPNHEIEAIMNPDSEQESEPQPA